MRGTLLLALLMAQEIAPQCGGGPGTSAAQNTQPIVVNPGPADNYFNGAFTSVTICAPAQSSSCQTIDGVLVDTGSSGLRLLSSALTVALPQQTGLNGAPIVECNQFVDGYTWGPVQTADIKLAGEQASAVPIQVIGAPGFSTVPASCSSTGPAENTLDDLGANGVLGIGSFRQDCGIACTLSGFSNPGLYFVCPAAGCQPTTTSLVQQVQNPVWLFQTDNNGVAVQLPAVPSGGESTASGTLVYGIGTQANNALGAAKVLTTDAAGNFTTVYAGQRYSSSFIDSGSNGYYFLDSPTTGLPACTDAPDFYCPPSPQNISATNQGANGISAATGFTVANADPMLADLRLSVFGEIAGPNPGGFDWGLPFFFGRTVFTAIEGQATPAGQGPYWAY